MTPRTYAESAKNGIQNQNILYGVHVVIINCIHEKGTRTEADHTKESI
jgi:hypothetical protein